MTDSTQTAELLPDASVCYGLGVLFPLCYLTAIARVRQNGFLRFHSFQCLLLFVIWVPSFFVRIHSAAVLLDLWFGAGLAAWIACVIQGKKRKWFQLPGLGPLAMRLAGTSTLARLEGDQSV